MAKERRLGAREVEEIFAAFAEAMRELPPDVEAGWLDAQGDLRLAQPQVVETLVSLPSDNSFASYEEAWIHLNGARLPNDKQVF